jgi:hypothetical protein
MTVPTAVDTYHRLVLLQTGGRPSEPELAVNRKDTITVYNKFI